MTPLIRAYRPRRDTWRDFLPLIRRGDVAAVALAPVALAVIALILTVLEK
jgi:hypothetical protein